MPFTSVSPVRAMKGYLTYALVNTMGALRGVGFESTLGGSVAEITANTRALLASGPKRRKREGYAVLISFDPKEFNPHDAGDVQRAKEHVLETLDRFAHNVPYVVIFHNDRGHLHAHVFLANHDLKTAKSFQGGVHKKLAKAFGRSGLRDGHLGDPEDWWQTRSAQGSCRARGGVLSERR